MPRRVSLRIALPAAAVCGLLSCSAVTGCESAKITTSPVSSPVASSSTGSATGSSSASSSAAQPALAKVGDTLELAGNDAGELMAVTVTSVVDPAGAADQVFSPSPGHRLIAVQFQLRDVGTSVYSDSPSNGAAVIDSQGQIFNATLDTSTAGPAFPGLVHLSPGETALGFITFDVPNGSAITKVQFTLSSGFAKQTGQWVVRGSAQTASAQPTSAPTATATTTVTAGSTVTASAAADPVQVVEDYYSAINSHDYARAWDLGGKNLAKSYSAFVAGFSGTDRDTLTIIGVNGGTVSVNLDAARSDGSHRLFSGTYTVQDGVITSAAIQ